MTVSIQGFNVGTDASFVVADNFGDYFPLELLGPVMDFESEALDRELEVVPISNGGVPEFQTVWAGVRGRITYTRVNGQFQQIVADLMSAYFDFGIIPIFTIGGAVLNRDGSIDEYLYTGVQFSRPRLGDYRAEREVTMGLEFRASRMFVTGPSVPVLLGVPNIGG